MIVINYVVASQYHKNPYAYKVYKKSSECSQQISRFRSECKNKENSGKCGKIVAENGGTLEIQSNSANLLYKEGDTKTKETDEFNIGKYNNLTYVDFQMDYSHQTDVSKALNGYKPLDMWLEEHETDDYLYFSLQEDCVGTGTRIAAQKFKNQI